MGKTIDYYLSKGFDQKTAEYFAQGRKSIINVKPVNNHALILTFDNGETRLLDLADLLEEQGTVFEPLRNPETFARVYLDECHCVAWDIDPQKDSSIYWENKIDLSPDTCYLDSLPIEGNTTA